MSTQKDAEVDIDLTDSDVGSTKSRIEAKHPVSDLIVLLDPHRVRLPSTANRLPKSQDDKSDDELTQSIAAVGTNEQPISVFPVEDDGDHDYEVNFGSRRVCACRAANVLVRAVIQFDVSKLQLGVSRLSENRGRKNPSPYEQGLQVKDILEVLGAPTQTALAARIGCDKSLVSRAYALANLNPAIVEILPDLTKLQFADGSLLEKAIEEHEDVVMAEVESIKAESPPLGTREAISRLLKAAKAAKGAVAPCNTDTTNAPQPITFEGRALGKWKISPKGIEISIATPMSEHQREKLVEQVSRFIGHTVLRVPRKTAASRKAVEPVIIESVS